MEFSLSLVGPVILSLMATVFPAHELLQPAQLIEHDSEGVANPPVVLRAEADRHAACRRPHG
jgi:hypothetical protein